MAKPRNAEFDAKVDASGRITVPGRIAREFRKYRGMVHVRLTADPGNDQLRRRGVTEEEIERIATVQLESREQAVRFLLSEQALKRSGITRRGR